MWVLCLHIAGVPRLPAQAQGWHHKEGLLRGSLKTDRPLPLYHTDTNHLWNRLFAVFYIRPSELAAMPEGYPSDPTQLDEYERQTRRGELARGPVVKRIEGGDSMNLLAWPETRYFSEPASFERENQLLDEFITQRGERLIDDPLKRAFLQRDLWAVFDHLAGQNIARFDQRSKERREILCRKLAVIVRRLALPKATIRALPNNYEAAARSDYFSAQGAFDSSRNYLPPGLLTRPEEWVEVDTSPEPLTIDDKHEGQIDYVAWNIRGRSYYRIFLRFPGGRAAVEEYLKYLREEGVDWEKAAHQGFMALKADVRQIPRGAEAAIVQFMVLLDEQLEPTPADVVESVRVSVYKNVDGAPDPETNTGRGVIARIYTGRRPCCSTDIRIGEFRRDNNPLCKVAWAATCTRRHESACSA